jgi:NADH:ubiquinone oxidoreductase subunit 4 (subunit M)
MFEFAGVCIVSVIMGLAQLLKKMGFKTRYIPIANLVMGLAAGIFILNPKDVRAGIVQGLAMGLSASGLFSSVKNVYQEATKDSDTAAKLSNANN